MKKNFSHPLLNPLIATLFYSLVFIVYTFPLITVFSTHVSGREGSDTAQYLWNIFIFKENLTQHQPLFYTDYICYPLGTNLFFHTYTPLAGAFALFFNNPYLALNVMTFIQFVLSGLGAYLLCKKINAQFIWCLFTGFMFAFGSYKMAHYTEHFNLILTATIPFYILCFMKAFGFSENTGLPVLHSVKYLFLSIVLMALTFLSDYYILFYLFFFTGLYLCFPYAQKTFYSLSVKARWITVLLFFLVCHTIANQFMLFYLDCKSAFWWQPDFLSFFIPSYFSPFFDTRSYYVRNSGPGASTEVVIFMGWFFSFLTFLTLYLYFRHKNKKLIPSNTRFDFYVFMSLFFVMMTVPEAKLLDEGYFYLPGSLFHFIPLLNNVRIPGRCVLMVSLFLPMVVGYLWVHFKPVIPKTLHVSIPIICMIISLIEFLPRPNRMLNRSEQQPINEWLAQKPGEVMMTFPLFILDGMHVSGIPQKEQLIDQIVHRKKILSGYVSRMNDDVFKLCDSDTVYKSLLYLQAHPDKHLPLLNKDQIALFQTRFKPDLIHVPAAYKKSNLHTFIRINFAPYTVLKDSLNGETVYGIHHF